MRIVRGWMVRSTLCVSLVLGGSVIGCGSDSDDDSTVVGSEAATEEGGEAAVEEGGEAPAEEGGEAPAEEGGEAPTEEGGEAAPEPVCPDLDLTGYYDLNFAVSAKPDPTVVWMDVVMTDDDSCYSGEVIAPSDSSKLADLESIVQVGDTLELTFRDFVIPAGQTDLLPDGGLADVFLTATSWTESTMCGDIVYALKDPFPLEDKGTFAAIEQDSGYTFVEELGHTCEAIGEAEEDGGEVAEEGGEVAEEGGEVAEEEGGEEPGEEGGEAVPEEGGEAVAEEGGEEAMTWTMLEGALEADCAPCHFGGYSAPFTKAYALENAAYMIQRIEDGTMPLGGVPASPDLIPAIQAWMDGGYQD